MSGRSPARFLAPAALVATFLALFVVLAGGGDGSEEEGQPAGGGSRPATTTTKTETTKSTSKKSSSSKRYTVKAGDTPSSIAEDAGIPLDELLELNPDIDPQALSPGQKLKLGP